MRVLILLSVLVAGVMLSETVAGAEPASVDLTCNQSPGSRYYWVERAFCDMESHGPDRANGIIIWNHGISGTTEQWRYPVPPVFRLLQARGWDVIALKRHNLAEVNAESSLYRTVQRTLEEVRQRRASGYKKVVLAGQSFGGYITLEAAEESGDVFAAIAMAPGVRSTSAAGRLDAPVTDRSLKRIKVERLALVFPKDDALFGHVIRGESANSILSARRMPYLLVDETSGITGHGGGGQGKFALRYGLCLSEFLSAPSVPPGRFACPEVEDWKVVQELLVPRQNASKVLDDVGSASPALAPFTGRWYTVLDETLVFLALAESDPPKVFYAWAASQIGRGTYAASLSDGSITFTLPNRARVAVATEGSRRVLKWTSADGTRVLTNTLFPVHSERELVTSPTR
jgi:pimeloyl-ACP methyl ester carboxylesterase